MVVYFDVPDVPGKYFTCVRYGTMSIASCARNFIAAPQSLRSGRLDGCVGCKVGAQHAGVGQSVAAPVAVQSIMHRTACVRCRRGSQESTSRLIGRMRLVRGHTICVSCYNREREVLHGANAKGARPKKWSCLFSAQVAYVRDTKVVRDRLASPVVDMIEVALTLMRQEKTSGVFWAAMPIVRLLSASRPA